MITDADIEKEAKPTDYNQKVLPLLVRNNVVHLLGFGNRLGFDPLPSELQKEEIKSCEERVKKLRDGCPPFEKQLVEKKTVQDGTKRRRVRWRLGNKELSQLWK